MWLRARDLLRVCCCRVDSAARVGWGQDSAIPFAGAVEWLGASVDTGSRMAVLPAAVKNALFKAFDADVMTEADVTLAAAWTCRRWARN